jgi:nucleolysin TIA-1/TIAR
MDTHENAATAIVSLGGFTVQGRPLKCSWGKDRIPESGHFAIPIQAYGFPPQAMQWYMPQGTIHFAGELCVCKQI